MLLFQLLMAFLQCCSLLQGNTVVDQTLAAERTSAEVWFGIEDSTSQPRESLNKSFIISR